MTLAVSMQMTAVAQESPMMPLRPDQVASLALYKELVETNTTLSAGNCTLLAERIGAHLRGAGFTDQEITPFSAAAIGDPGVKISLVQPIRPMAVPPPLDPGIIGAAEKLVAKYFPGCLSAGIS
jgi:hypothetical protein